MERGTETLKARLSAPSEMTKSLRAFIAREKLPIEIVSTPNADVEVVQSKRPGECRENRLLAGGWISCTCAHGVAAKLRIEPKSMGKLLNHLSIKIRQCELGLF